MEGRTLPSREVGSCGGKEGLGELCMDERRRGEELEEVRFDGDLKGERLMALSPGGLRRRRRFLNWMEARSHIRGSWRREEMRPNNKATRVWWNKGDQERCWSSRKRGR
uniref:Uncharacterized protein n=1 Tax=Oryza nivara TaxID=4536 RepID=A0A0E0H3M7_ORYNI